MSGPTHHVDDEVLLAYVAGTTTESVALLVACHLTLCAACRKGIAVAETMGGALLDDAQSSPLSEDVLERVLARLDETTPEVRPVPVHETTEPFVFAGVSLPRPLARYLEHNRQADHPRRMFRFLAPGLRGIDLPVRALPGVRTRLLWLDAGVEIPRHAHAAPEFTLVFSGGLSDGGEHFDRGDVRFRDTAAEHVQLVDSDRPCVALVVNEGALLPQTWRGKLISFLFDR